MLVGQYAFNLLVGQCGKNAGDYRRTTADASVLQPSLQRGTSWVDLLYSTRPFCKRKCELISSLQKIAEAEWGLDLAQFVITEVGLSHRQYQTLRNAFSRSLFTPVNSSNDVDPRAGMYTPRSWYA